MKASGRGLAEITLIITLLIIGVFGILMSAGGSQSQSSSGYDIFLSILIFVPSVLAIVLALQVGRLLRQGKQKIILRILFLCFTAIALTFEAVILMSGWVSFILPSFFVFSFGAFFFLAALVHATIEDGNLQDQNTWKESLYGAAILFVVMLLMTTFVSSFTCSQEPKFCPGGSPVWKSGPQCEFAPCPDVSVKKEYNSQVICEGKMKVCPDGSTVWGRGSNCEFDACPIQTGCTIEEKLCSDGSVVRRSGPKCEFNSCPDVPLK